MVVSSREVGRTNQVMGPEEVKQRLLATGSSSWDNQIEVVAIIKDLDEQSIKEFISKVKECGRRAIPSKEGFSATLEKLGLTVNEKPTRAAILLLGKNPQGFYSTAYIKAGRFKSLTMIVDDKEFGGTLFQQLDATMAWFRDRLETRLLIGSEKTSRTSIWKLSSAPRCLGVSAECSERSTGKRHLPSQLHFSWHNNRSAL